MQAEKRRQNRIAAMKAASPLSTTIGASDSSSISSATSLLTGASSYAGGGGGNIDLGPPCEDPVGAATESLIREAEVAMLDNKHEQYSLTDQVHNILQDSIIDFNVAPADEEMINLDEPPSYEEFVVGKEHLVTDTKLHYPEELVVGEPPSSTSDQYVSFNKPISPSYNEDMINFVTPSESSIPKDGGFPEQMVGFNTPLTIHSDGPANPATPVKHGLEDFLFVDEETGKPAGITDIPSDGATEQIITFKKPETETLGFDTNRPEVSEDFVLYGTSDSGIKSSSNAVIGSFEHDVTPASSKSSSASLGGDELIFSPSSPELVTGGSSTSPLGGE